MPAESTKTFLTRGLVFILIGCLLYAVVYAISEGLVYHYAQRNRFYVVKTAPLPEYDCVILGASRAAVFDYEDMNARLESMTGAKILNLSVVGGGVTVNRLLLEYFLAKHRTKKVVYFIDSFAFYSRDWNENRLNDARLFVRAPFDPVLARLLLRDPASRSIALEYVAGFSKINNPDRFKPDISDDELTRFKRTYRPVRQIDTQRLEYLYSKPVDRQVLNHYLSELDELVRYVKQRDIRLIVIKPPLPARIYKVLPSETQFDDALKAVLAPHGIEFHDLSLAGNDDKYFFNTDHLNRAGVLNFFEGHLKPILVH